MKYKMIIVEGPDGAGKTTLIEKLTKELTQRGRLVHCHAHGPYLDSNNIIHHYLQSLEMIADLVDAGTNEAVLILDRAWYSEPIYGAHMRHGKIRLCPADLAYLEFKAMVLGTLVILCYPPTRDCLDAYKRRREVEYVDKEDKLIAIHHDYGQWFNAFYKIPKLFYNFKHDETATALFKEIP